MTNREDVVVKKWHLISRQGGFLDGGPGSGIRACACVFVSTWVFALLFYGCWMASFGEAGLVARS